MRTKAATLPHSSRKRTRSLDGRFSAHVARARLCGRGHAFAVSTLMERSPFSAAECRPPLGIAILHRKTHSQAYLPATSHIGATVQSSQILRGTRCAFRSTRKEGGRGQSTPSTPFDVGGGGGGGGGHCLRKPSSNANRQKRSSGRRFPNSVLASSNATSDADDGGRLSAGERGERRPRTYAI